MAFLPFETLIMPDGRYLIEKYHITYTQSLGISELIASRKYSKNRKPLLAFDGAIYEKTSEPKTKDDKEEITSPAQLLAFQKDTHATMNRGGNLRNAYRKLGYASWGNLPDTLTEVNALKTIIASPNGLSVSLWQVADKSTMKFMVGMYTLVKKGHSYAKAITIMKRKFLKGKVGKGAYKNPYFWAPFVYYGR